MSFLAPLARDNRVTLAVLGLGVAGAAVVIRYCLESFRDGVEIRPAQPKTHYITQETEDALRPGTLDTLLGHYNYAIRETAAKIVCDRALNDGETIEALLIGVTKADYDERIKNLRCLAIITDHQSLYLLHNWKAYSALVRSLELCLDSDQEELSDKYFDEYYLRDMSEKLCLMFLSQLVARYDAEKLVQAHFVEKWLARQNWGRDAESRSDNFMQYMHTKTNRITDIVSRIQDTAVGRRALFRAGLIGFGAPPSPSPHRSRGGGEESDDGDGDAEGNAERRGSFSLFLSLRMHDEDGDDRSASRRSMEQSAEEQRLRHRHREAMVLNDGSRPFNSEDIIQRDPELPP